MPGRPIYVEVYRRADGTWAWRARDPGNLAILATDGGQGYERRIDCVRGLAQVIRPEVEILLGESGEPLGYVRDVDLG